MNLNSRLFDRIRIRPAAAEEPPARPEQVCDKPGCGLAGAFRAPKGRGKEGQFFRFCIDHVREYNASYNYFAGMNDDAVAAYQKDAVIGHRPTWTMGVNPAAKKSGEERPEAPPRDWSYSDPLGILRGQGFAAETRRPAEPAKPRRSELARRALDVLGLDEDADGPTIKAQYKALVKKFHPDAHGGDRSFEERLRDIIKAHDTLKAAGLC